MADDQVDIKVQADSGNAAGEAEKLSQQLKQLRDQVDGFQSGLAGFRDKIVAAFTIDKLLEFGQAMMDAASASERLEAALGVNAQTVATLNALSAGTGGSVTGIANSMSQVSDTVAKANAGVEGAIDKLADLGLKAKDFKGLNFNETFDLIAEKVSVMKDGTEKTAIVTALLGQAGLELLPVLNQGAGALEEYNAIVKRAGSEATPEFKEAMGDLEMATIELQQSLSGVGQTAATSFASAFEGAIKITADLVQQFNNSVKSGGTMYYVLQTLVVAARSLATAFLAVVVIIRETWEVIKAFVNAASQLLFDFSMAMGKLLTFDVTGAKEGFAKLRDNFRENAAGLARDMVGAIGNAKEQLATIWGQGEEAEEKAAQTQTANRRRRNQNALAASLAFYEGEVRAAQQAYQQKAALLDLEVARGNITQNQKFAQLMLANQQAYAEMTRALQAELALEGLKPQQRAQINARLQQLERQHQIEMLNLNRQSLQAQVAMWSQYTDTVAGSFNGQLRGILTGMTSASQAMKNILLDLSVRTIELIATQPLAKFLAAKLAELTATQTTAAASAAAQVAASEATLPAKIAAFTSDITARGAQVFAGVFANLAPLLGPAAAGPAAASQATVLAQMVNVPKFDVGSWSIPQTGLAVVHRGETILPAGAPADAYRSGVMSGGGAGGGRAPVMVGIQAWDGPSVARWLNNGGAELLAKKIARAQDRNPSLRPRQA